MSSFLRTAKHLLGFKNLIPTTKTQNNFSNVIISKNKFGINSKNSQTHTAAVQRNWYKRQKTSQSITVC
uniref:Uncharacterized protein n=1 Tax=Octopus bimaculoides TaxID=37653 RepID=A0A0L8GCG5_OCTBM